LTQLSAFWFRRTRAVWPNHFISVDPAAFPFDTSDWPPEEHAKLAGRSMLVRRTRRIDIECVVRGYLTGSGWKEYQRSGAVCGVGLPLGLHDGSKLELAIFTPATKNDVGHDENISFERMCTLVTRPVAEQLRERSLALYHEARAHAWARGLVLADTKFEFGRIDGQLALIDEALSPDSSRYWDRTEYEAGRLLSFDKQFVRDWLDSSGWNHEPPAPALPASVVTKTQERYLEAIRRLSGAGA
jgi:phosphoribosylaminoimidazole-succinocarboxamide synthase